MQTVVRVLASIAALVLVAATSTLRAQQSDPTTRPLVRGDHVRLYQSASDSTPVVGRLRSIGNDSISVVPDEDATVRVLFAHRDVARIEVERDAGMRDQVSTVMAGLGMLGGAAAALYQCLDNRDQCAAEADARARAAENGDPYVDKSLLLVAGGGLAGALLGYLIAPAPSWEVIAFPTRAAALDGTPHWGLSLGVRHQLGAR
jgi:hypothetical protein